MSNRSPKPPLLVFADDWGRHPSSCQYLIRELMPEYQVCWVNTIGMRSLRFDKTTFARGVGKLRSWLSTKDKTAPGVSNPQIANPAMWPSFRRLGRPLNRVLLDRQLQPLIRAMRSAPVAITTLPITADLMGRLPVAHWVYYCVDDFSQWPGLDQAPLAAMEEELVDRCDRLIAVSETLCDRLSRRGKQVDLLTHGVHLNHWRGEEQREDLVELAGLERPLVVFWGLIDRRLDVDFVASVATSLERGTVLLVGPQSDAAPALWKLPRVRHVPAMAYERLPQLATSASVLIMPYADLPVTRAMQPLKLNEYLATGKPVVVRDLPAASQWADCLDLAATPTEFAQAVGLRLSEGLPAGQAAARARLNSESWTAKAQRFEELAISGKPVAVNKPSALSAVWQHAEVLAPGT